MEMSAQTAQISRSGVFNAWREPEYITDDGINGLRFCVLGVSGRGREKEE